ncbi:hypothetical protein D3C86_2033700 [compost metagenome]
MMVAEGQGIHPAGRIAVGVEAVERVGAGLWLIVAGVALVFTVADFQAAIPGFAEVGIDETGQAA